MNKAILYLLLFFFWLLSLWFISVRLDRIEKLRCDVWRWEVCEELMK
jgi:hypothetical protein